MTKSTHEMIKKRLNILGEKVDTLLKELAPIEPTEEGNAKCDNEETVMDGFVDDLVKRIGEIMDEERLVGKIDVYLDDEKLTHIVRTAIEYEEDTEEDVEGYKEKDPMNLEVLVDFVDIFNYNPEINVVWEGLIEGHQPKEHLYDFSGALVLMNAGNSMCRKGWNGKDMYVNIQWPDQNSKMTKRPLYIKTTDGDLVPWTVSQEDVLASDWMFYNG